MVLSWRLFVTEIKSFYVQELKEEYNVSDIQLNSFQFNFLFYCVEPQPLSSSFGV